MPRLGWWQLLVYAGCAAGPRLLFRRKVSVAEVELERVRRRLADNETRLVSERSQFEELRMTVQQELAQQSGRLDKREQAFADRLVTYHEWMEFPQPIELSHPAPTDAALAELARQDRQLQELLGRDPILYDNIRKTNMRRKARFCCRRFAMTCSSSSPSRPHLSARHQAAAPGVSLARIFRAASRASLHAGRAR
jgi:hypothetical protein